MTIDPHDLDADAERPIDEELESDEADELALEVPLEVSPADAVDQHRVVPLDDDEHDA